MLGQSVNRRAVPRSLLDLAVRSEGKAVARQTELAFASNSAAGTNEWLQEITANKAKNYLRETVANP